MDNFKVGDKVYVVVITQDDAGVEIGVWCSEQQIASITIEPGGLSMFSMELEQT